MKELLLAFSVFISVLSGFIGILFWVRYRRGKKQLQDKIKTWEINKSGFFSKVNSRLTEFVNDLEWTQNIETDLKGAGLSIQPSQFAIIYGISIVASIVLIHLLFNLGIFWDIVLGFAVVRFGVKRYLKMKQDKLVQMIDKQLPEVSRLLSSSIKAGLNIQQGLEVVSQEMKDPAGSIFRTISNELKLGALIEDTFEGLMEDVKSRELKLMANTILIQRRAGGNLALILEEMAQTLEQRHRVNEEIEGSTAESKFAAYILPIMPIMAALLLNVMFPGALLTLLTPLGIIVGAVFIGLQMLGFYLINKISNIRV